MKYLLASILILSSFAPSAFAEDTKITGAYSITEEKNFAFFVDGAAAKELFDRMKQKAVHEECTGGMEKTDASGMHCIKAEDGTYACDFGYDFKKHAFSGSGDDC
ncbi:hypothetical protein [Aestuariivirga litoralis]|uniref:hypothetical protein n=1 Tax=Aestuariivirga litoralis TaxID=2650924 RepID=UPI0018C6AC97|nr:hypothetical protein [Aestuariivirga litoralis]MBG1231437.1 hypothetical protein [Aestuariivirga litoralis]